MEVDPRLHTFTRRANRPHMANIYLESRRELEKRREEEDEVVGWYVMLTRNYVVGCGVER